MNKLSIALKILLTLWQNIPKAGKAKLFNSSTTSRVLKLLTARVVWSKWFNKRKKSFYSFQVEWLTRSTRSTSQKKLYQILVLGGVYLNCCNDFYAKFLLRYATVSKNWDFSLLRHIITIQNSIAMWSNIVYERTKNSGVSLIKQNLSRTLIQSSLPLWLWPRVESRLNRTPSWFSPALTCIVWYTFKNATFNQMLVKTESRLSAVQ